MPSFDVVIANRTLIPNPFWGGILFPLVVMVALLAWPWLERRVRGDRASHNVLDRPRDAPVRTAIGAGFLTWVVLIFMAGASDRVLVFLNVSYASQIDFYRVAVWVVPVIVGLLAWRLCLGLKAKEAVEHDRDDAVRSARLAPPPAGSYPSRAAIGAAPPRGPSAGRTKRKG
jgi:ubiquinol-cytochrome c reductase cytochrome b subunit